MIFDSHPIRFAQSLAEKLGAGWKLSFSSYFYRPSSVFDERFIFWVDAAEVTDDWLSSQLEGLPEGWELAFNSTIRDDRGRTHHVGLIDFAEDATIISAQSAVHRMLGDDALRSLSIYDSGRSYHGYISELMIPKEWRSFLGRLLLMNGVSSAPVVDSRWIGHRLLGDYCALRWSMNTSWYRSMPKKVW